MKQRNRQWVWGLVSAVVLSGISGVWAAPSVLTGNVMRVGVDDSGGLLAEDGDGNLVGISAYCIDFISPGYSLEGYSIGINGRAYFGGYDFGHNVDIVATTEAVESDTVLRAVTTGHDVIELDDGTPSSRIAFEQVLSFSPDSSIIDFEVTLRNISGTDFEEVSYARYLDPDSAFPSFQTYNEVVSGDLVIAKAAQSSGLTLGIYSDSAYPHHASVTGFQFDPDALFEAPEYLYDPADATIAIAWNIGSLAPGQEATLTFQYRMGLSPEDVINPPVLSVPAPGAFALAGIGLGVFGWWRRRGAPARHP